MNEKRITKRHEHHVELLDTLYQRALDTITTPDKQKPLLRVLSSQRRELQSILKAEEEDIETSQLEIANEQETTEYHARHKMKSSEARAASEYWSVHISTAFITAQNGGAGYGTTCVERVEKAIGLPEFSLYNIRSIMSQYTDTMLRNYALTFMYCTLEKTGFTIRFNHNSPNWLRMRVDWVGDSGIYEVRVGWLSYGIPVEEEFDACLKKACVSLCDTFVKVFSEEFAILRENLCTPHGALQAVALECNWKMLQALNKKLSEIENNLPKTNNNDREKNRQ